MKVVVIPQAVSEAVVSVRDRAGGFGQRDKMVSVIILIAFSSNLLIVCFSQVIANGIFVKREEQPPD